MERLDPEDNYKECTIMGEHVTVFENIALTTQS